MRTLSYQMRIFNSPCGECVVENPSLELFLRWISSCLSVSLFLCLALSISSALSSLFFIIALLYTPVKHSCSLRNKQDTRVILSDLRDAQLTIYYKI